MSETTRKLRAFKTYSVGACGVRDLAADAIEAVEAQVAEAAARVAALEEMGRLGASPNGDDRTRGGMPPRGFDSPTPAAPTPPAPSAVPAPRGFREGDIVRIKRTANGHEGWHGQEGPLVRDGIGLRPKLRFKGIGEPLVVAFHPHEYDLVRAADAPEAPAEEDTGLVVQRIRDEATKPLHVEIEKLRGEVARLTAERDDWKYAAEVQKKDTESWKARAEAAEETQRLRDAAISVCATSNTRESATRHRLDRSNPNWSHGYERVYEAVEREMCHRERAEAAEKDLAALRAKLAETERECAEQMSGVATKLHDAGFNNVENLVGAYRFERAQADDLRAKLAAAEQALDVEKSRHKVTRDRNVENFKRAESAEKALADARAISAATAERVRTETQTATELRNDLADANDRLASQSRSIEEMHAELVAAQGEMHSLRATISVLRADLAALRSKPRFRTRKVTKADVEEFIAHDGSFYESLRALGFRRRVDGAK